MAVDTSNITFQMGDKIKVGPGNGYYNMLEGATGEVIGVWENHLRAKWTKDGEVVQETWAVDYVDVSKVENEVPWAVGDSVYTTQSGPFQGKRLTIIQVDASDSTVYVRTADGSGYSSWQSWNDIVRVPEQSRDEATLEDILTAEAMDQAFTAQRRARKAENDLALFKVRVREYVIEQAASHDWCEAGVNRHLDALGLEGWQKEKDYDVEFTISGTITVTATDEDDAAQMVRDSVCLQSDYYISGEEYETQSVYES